MRIKLTFKQRLWTVITISVLLTVIMALFGITLSKQVTDFDKQWSDYNQNYTAQTSALSSIKNNFGYGGFIHNFKNYILRKDPLLAEKIKNDLNATYQAIEFFPYDNAHEEAKQAITTIKQVVDEYAVKFKLAQKLVAEGVSSKDIDIQVRVDDRPAIATFDFISQHLQQDSQQQLQKTERVVYEILGLLNWGVLLLPLILIVTGTLIIFMRYNLKINQQLNDAGQYMEDLFDAAPDAILIIDNAGRIQQINNVAIDLLGYSKEQLLSMNVEALLPSRFRNSHVALREGAFESPQHRLLENKMEFFAQRQDGSEIPVDISINYTQKNNELQAITILRDISGYKNIENTLTHSENLLKKAQEINQIGSWEWNIKTDKLAWSGEIFTIFGLDANEFGVNYDRFLASVHQEDRDLVADALNQAVVFDKPYDIEHKIVRPNGEIRFVHERGDVFRNENGEAESIVGTVIDITEQKHAEQELKLADNVFNHTTEAIMVTDGNKKILRVNKAFEEITGYSKKEALGKKPEDILHSGKHDKQFYKDMWLSIDDSGDWDGEIIDRRKNGELFYSWHNISAITDKNNRIIQYTSIFSDISKQKEAEERINNLAHFDQLTQLPNRMLFNDRLQHAIVRSNRSQSNMGLMFIDLDGFKLVNDSLGHQAGDLLLQQVAERLSSCVREQDTVARLGGDEFMIILESLAHTEDGALVANKVLKSLSEKFQLDKQEANIGASIGISIFPDDGVDAELLIKRADTAMYEAKNNGKNQYRYYSHEMHI